jgi:enolase
MEHTLSSVYGREVLDSRGNPTLEVEVGFSDGAWGRAIVPSGASRGENEALELRDGDKKRFLGKGVQKAAKWVSEEGKKALVSKRFSTVADLDKLLLQMDGTEQKTKIGGNTILGLSLAFAQASAAAQKRPLYLVLNEWMGVPAGDMKLPVPLMNILNGGMHANNGLEIQEFMIVPHGFSDFASALRAGVEVFHHLKDRLHHKGMSTAVGDEGGFAPELANNEAAVQEICSAIEAAGYRLGEQVALALDCAASSFYNKDKGAYDIKLGGKSTAGSAEMLQFYGQLCEKYPIVSIEDGLDENDWTGWRELTAKYGKRVQLVGDDLFCTQARFVKRGIEEKAANAVLVKVNQVGSLTETFETMALCRKNGYRAVVSHRSGETEDTTIAHLAVASGCGQIKTGSASRSERTAKYNELLRISDNAARGGKPIAFAKWGAL